MANWQKRRAFVVLGLGTTTVLVFLMHRYPATLPSTRIAQRRNRLETFKVEVDNDRKNSTVIVEGEALLPVRNGTLASYRRDVIAATFKPNTSVDYYQPRKNKVNKLDARFLIANKGFCDESVPYLLVVVPSIATHTSERTAIRNTYGSYRTPWRLPTRHCSGCANNSSRDRVMSEKRTKVLFFFGRGENAEIDQMLLEESKRHGDIVQADFHESYANLTLKMMIILKWVANYCGKVDYVLKTNENVFIHIPRLISQLHPLQNTLGGLVIGDLIYESQVIRSGKWEVRTEEFPLSIYPTYANGIAYVISGNIIPRMFSVSEYIPYMPIEDAFVTGILAKIVGSKHIFMEGFAYWFERVQRPCDFIRQNGTIAPKIGTEEIREFWEAQTKFEQKCLTSEEYYKPRMNKVNRLDTTFLIANKGFCDDSAPYLLVVVISIATHTIERTAIRNTYGSYRTSWRFPMSHCISCMNNNSREGVAVKRAKVLFFFGRGENPEIDQLLLEESKRHGDIVQADFHESYANLTLKMMVILKWVTSFCGGVDYVLKIDEDVFVNIPKLLSQLHPLPNTVEGLVIGYLNYDAAVHISGKWGVRTDQFPLSTYPTYASGNAYVISGNIIPRMFSISEYMQYIPIEDVFVTGILAKIVGSKHIFMEGFTNWLESTPIPCDFVRQNKTSATKVDAALMRQLWEAQTKFEKICLTSEEYYQPRKNKVNRLNARFLITNKGFCDESVPYLLVVVPSIATNTSKRTAIRKTYGSYRTTWRLPTSHCSSCTSNSSRESAAVKNITKVLFFFGRGENPDINQMLREESKRHGDIVQADFHESYANLTLKMMVILKWVTSFCEGVDYVLKIDEDVFVNIPKLLSQLHPLPSTVGGLVVGDLINEESQVHRSGKWQVKTEEFPLSAYPIYASGNSYVISGNIIPRMFSVSEFMPYMPIEDVFITGILAKIVGSKHIFMEGFTNWFETAPIPCDFVRQNKTTATKVDAALMRQLWEAQTMFEQKCQ